MPFESEAQRRWMYANHPEMAKEWESHTPKGKKLPKRVHNSRAYYIGASRVFDAYNGRQRPLLSVDVYTGMRMQFLSTLPGGSTYEEGALAAMEQLLNASTRA